MPTPAKVHRTVLLQQRASCDAAAKISEEPFAQQYREICRQCDELLAGLPADDQPVEDKHLSALPALLASSNALCTLLTGSLDSFRKGQPAAIAAAVTSEIASRVKAGELFDKASVAPLVVAEIKRLTEAGEIVPKTNIDQLCSAAKTNGVAEGEKKVRDELAAQAEATKKITERKTSLQTSSFPLPDADNLLAGTEEEFAARKTKAETRKQALQKAGFNLNPELLANVWKSDVEFAGFEKLIATIPALKGNAEAFAGGGSGGGPSLPI